MIHLPTPRKGATLPTIPAGGGRLLLCSLVCAALAVLALGIDLPVSEWFKEPRPAGTSELIRLIELSEIFAHGTGVALICLAVLVLDRARRRAVPRLIACAYASGIAADIVKLFVPRLRPAVFVVGDVFNSFLDAQLPQIEPIEPWALASFPSAHAATAVGLAVGLTRLYPHGRWLFATYAMLAIWQRIVARAHWPSDTLCGAALGFLVCAVLCSPRLAGRWFERLEAGGGARIPRAR